jgi:AraC family transcriptional regulator, transcriptional activator FtrA
VALAYDGLCTFEFGLVVEVFGLDRPELPPLSRPWYELTVAAVDPPPLRAAGGVRVAVDAGLDALDGAGTIIVPGWRALDDDPPAELVERLVAAVERGGRLVSICSGVFLLAATGLLDGRRAATHWRHADRLRARRPAVEVDPDVLYVDEGSIITSAGSAAGLDACLHLVRRDHGPEVAGLVARRLVVPPHRDGGQAQFVPRPSGPPARGPEVAAVARAMDWATERLDRPLTVEDLARAVDVSPRTFSRRFAEQVGTSPYRWLTTQRLARARDLLETTDAPIDEVAAACGFATAATLRHHFTRALGTSPSGYRRRFGTGGTVGTGGDGNGRGNGRTNPVGSTLGR